MARKTTTLTDTEIKKSKAKEKDYKLFDGRGLFLIIKTNGGKWWRLKYRVDGKEKSISLGTYPETSLSDAREKRESFKADIAKGIDPSVQRKEEKDAIVVKEIEDQAIQEGQFHIVVNKWLDSLVEADNTHNKRVRSFECDILPHFCAYDKSGHIVSSKHIDSITHPELLKVLLLKEKKAPVVANRRYIDCKRLWKYAINHGYTEVNVADRITPDAFQKHIEKHRPKITDEKILAELLRAIDSYRGSVLVRNLLRLNSFTMLRIGNLARLKWQDIDIEKGIITISRDNMKMRDPNMPDFVLPLSTQAIEVLKDTKEYTGWGEWVFHGHRNQNTHINVESGNRALKDMGFNDEASGRKQTLHSFRGTYGSLARTHHKDHGASYEALEKALDHNVDNKVARAYSHMADYTEQIRELLQWWADFLDDLKKVEHA